MILSLSLASLLIACAHAPPEPPAGSAPAGFTSWVGQKVHLEGQAADAKLGAVVLVDGEPVYLKGMLAWPADVTGKTVRVNGILEEDSHEDEILLGPNGEQSASMAGSQWLIDRPTWTVVP